MAYLPPEENWRTFYEEMEPQARQRLLEENMREGNAEDLLRKEIFERRHPRNPKPDALRDVFLWQCVELIYLHRSAGRPFVNTRKKTLAAAAALGLAAEGAEGAAKAMTDAEAALYYWEFRNTARRYFSTCNGPDYRKKFFGLASITEEERVQEIVKDAFRMGEGIAHETGLEDMMRPWSDAMRDEYAARDVLAAERYAALREKELGA